VTDKLPWMPFYGTDFYESESVRLMDFTEQAIYLRMLWRQWRFDSLPVDPEEIEKVIEVSGITPRVLEMFPLGRDGRRRNVRMQRVWQEQLAIREVRARTGSLGGKAKARRKQTDSKPVANGKQKARNKEPDTDTETTLSAERRSGEDRRDTWLTPFAEHWERRCGNPPYGKLASVLATLVKTHGAPDVIARWSRYLDATEPRYCGPHRFAETYNTWGEPDTKEMTNQYGAMALHRRDASGEWVEVAS
jgi:hypothetical protein